jgi:hypothetical protein
MEIRRLVYILTSPGWKPNITEYDIDEIIDAAVGKGAL